MTTEPQETPMHPQSLITKCLGGAVLLTLALAVIASPPEQPTDKAARQRAARFLAQATFGADVELIEEVAELGEAAWLGEQLDEPPTLHLPFTVEVLDHADEAIEEILDQLDVDEEEVELGIEEVFGDLFNPSRRFAWWQAAITAPDQLRQRVAFALSQILVVSDRADELADRRHQRLPDRRPHRRVQRHPRGPGQYRGLRWRRYLRSAAHLGDRQPDERPLPQRL